MAFDEPGNPKTAFHAMTEGTPEQWANIIAEAAKFRAGLVDRLMGQMRMLDDGLDGYAVTRLEHSLQTATRAVKAGKDEEYVVCALLHDIGDLMGPANHAEIAAVILKPYVSEANHWMLDKHGIFQGYYFFDHIGLDKDMREQFRGHPHFEYCAQFCHLYDQNSFDPAYQSMKLEDFEPMMHRIFAKPKNSIYLRKPKD